MSGHGQRFNPEKASKLLDPSRKKIIDPLEVIKMIGLSREDTVADLGAGNGYFSIPIAEYTNQTVYAVDIEPKMFHSLQENAKALGIKNIT
nr:methyltransferase domain-containing protein [Oceanobacillus salinisoli]